MGSMASSEETNAPTAGNSSPLEIMQAQIENEPVVMFSSPTCPYCVRAKGVLGSYTTNVTVVELTGAQRRLLPQLTGRTSVPAVFIGGVYAGGANDGGLGGIVTLHERGELESLLREAGAI